MKEVQIDKQLEVQTVKHTADGITLAVEMTFPRKGMANMLDSWRDWLDQGKSAQGQPYLGVQIPVDAVLRALSEAEAGDRD